MKKNDFKNLIKISKFDYHKYKDTTTIQWYLQEELFREIRVFHPYKQILGIEFVKFKDFNYTILIITKFDVLVVSLPQLSNSKKITSIEDIEIINNEEENTEQEDFIEFNIELPFPIKSYKKFYSGLILTRDLEYLTEDTSLNVSNDDMFCILDDPFRECSFINFNTKSKNILSLLECSDNLLDNGYVLMNNNNFSIDVYKLISLKAEKENLSIEDSYYKYSLVKIETVEKQYDDINLYYKENIDCEYFGELCYNNILYFLISLKNEKRNIEMFINTENNKIIIKNSIYQGTITNMVFNEVENYFTFTKNGENFINNPFYLSQHEGNINSSIKVSTNFSFNIISTHIQRYFNMLEACSQVSPSDIFLNKVLFCCLKEIGFNRTESEIFDKFMTVIMRKNIDPLEFQLDEFLIKWKDDKNNKKIYVNWIFNLMALHEELMLNVLETDERQNLAMILLKYAISNNMSREIKTYYLKSCYSFLLEKEFISPTFSNETNSTMNDIPTDKIFNDLYDSNNINGMEFEKDNFGVVDFMQRIYKFANLIEKVKIDCNYDIEKSEDYKQMNELLNSIENGSFGNKKLLPRIFKIATILKNFIQVNKNESPIKILKHFNVDEHFLDTLPIGVSSFIKKIAIEYEENLCNLSDLKDNNIQMLFLRKDLQKTFDSINKDTLKIKPSFNVTDADFLFASRILAFMLPITNHSLFDNKINYAERDLVKIDCFLKQMCKPLGWGLLTHGSNAAHIFSNEEKFKFDTVNYSIASVFDEKTILTNNNYNKYIPLQFINKSEFQTGIAQAIQFPKNLSGLDFLWVMNNKPQILNPQYGGFLYGLGLQGYLKNLEEWQIYNIIVNKYTPVSIGMLLGITCSNKGSCNNLITKLLVIHLEHSLPSKSIDLNHHYTLQIASILSFGMLYSSSSDRKISNLMMECLVGKVAINGSYRFNESYTIASGISLGLINLNENGENSNNIRDMILVEKLLGFIASRETEFVIGPIMAICFMFIRSDSNEIIKKLDDLFDGKFDGFDLQVKFYYHLVRALISWNEMNDDWLEGIIKNFKTEVSMIKNPFHLKLIYVYYKLSGCLMAYAIKNVGMRSEKLKNFCLPLIDRLLSLIKIDHLTSYNMKLFFKHLASVRNIILEAVSLNFCGSCDIDILKRCKFILTEESTSILSSNNMSRNEKNLHSIDNFRNPNFIFSNTQDNGNEVLLNEYNNEMPNEGVSESYEEEDDEEEEDDDDEEEEEEEDFDGNGSNTNDSTDKKPEYIEKIGQVSEIFSLYSTASFAMGLLLLGGGRKIINISSDNEKLAFLVTSMLPVTNQFPFELQELRHLYIMSVEDSYLIIKDCDSDEIVPVDIICKMEGSKNSLITIKTPSTLVPIEELESIEINHKDYYRIIIEKKELMKKKNKEFIIYIKSRKKFSIQTVLLNNSLNSGYEQDYRNEDSQFKEMLINEQKTQVKDWNLDLLTISKELTTNNLDLWQSRK